MIFQLIRNNVEFLISTQSIPDQMLKKESNLTIFSFNPANYGNYECRALVGKRKTATAKFIIQNSNYYFYERF